MAQDRSLQKADRAVALVHHLSRGVNASVQSLMFQAAATVESVWLDGQDSFIQERTAAYHRGSTAYLPVSDLLRPGDASPPDLHDAIQIAHGAADCGDYYCGCWDQKSCGCGLEHPEWGRDCRHVVPFLAKLRELGYEIVRAQADA